MKKYLPVLLLVYGSPVLAQNYRQQDSLVMNWIQNLPHTGLPCNQIRLVSLDTIGKLMKARNLKYMDIGYKGQVTSIIDPCNRRIALQSRQEFLDNILPFRDQYIRKN
jgi:hypothetical protein